MCVMHCNGYDVHITAAFHEIKISVSGSSSSNVFRLLRKTKNNKANMLNIHLSENVTAKHLDMLRWISEENKSLRLTDKKLWDNYV